MPVCPWFTPRFTPRSTRLLHLALLSTCAVSLAQAQTPTPTPVQTKIASIQRSVIEKAEVSVPGREALVVRIEIDAGASAGRHTHPGDEISYILDGEAELRIDGQPARRVRAGAAIIIPAGVIHDAVNVGSGTLKVVGVYLVEPGKPLVSAAK